MNVRSFRKLDGTKRGLLALLGCFVARRRSSRACRHRQRRGLRWEVEQIAVVIESCMREDEGRQPNGRRDQQARSDARRLELASRAIVPVDSNADPDCRAAMLLTCRGQDKGKRTHATQEQHGAPARVEERRLPCMDASPPLLLHPHSTWLSASPRDQHTRLQSFSRYASCKMSGSEFDPRAQLNEIIRLACRAELVTTGQRGGRM
ncbi:hypothetical protein L1887_55059 [Cichorium endivia]|nr:hypothetical protein L1887_55059 [Cichorium endivia]